MKKIKQIITNWEPLLQERCSRLNHKQRVKLLWIFSIRYFLLTIMAMVWTYMDTGKNKISVQHIENPIPVNTLKKQVTPDSTLPQKLK